MALDLIMFTARTLFHFAVAGTAPSQDIESLMTQKLHAWDGLDALGTALLRGLGWRYEAAVSSLEGLVFLRDTLKDMTKTSAPNLDCDLWLQHTAAGLAKCLLLRNG